MSLLDWPAEQLRRVRERLPPLPVRKRAVSVSEPDPHTGEERVPMWLWVSESSLRPREARRWPDKVRGFQWAARAHERAVRERRFDDARWHGRALAHLADDLRGGR